MERLLKHERRLTDHFIGHVLAKNIGIEQDPLDHLFRLDSTEKRALSLRASGAACPQWCTMGHRLPSWLGLACSRSEERPASSTTLHCRQHS
jgi:hypothetical protein